VQTDYDGTSTASQIVIVKPDELNAAMKASVQPNPFADAATIEVSSPKAAEATLRITDMNGKVVAEKRVSLYKGETALPLTDSENEWGSGVYFVHLITEKQTIMIRIVKAK
jgi:hypothetical protein